MNVGVTTKHVAVWDNWNAPGGATNTLRGLTHSLDQTKEGLAMKATRVCSVGGCDRPVNCRGWCATHYQQWKTTGQEPKMLDLAGRIADRFTILDNGCWVVEKINPRTGYGSISVGPRVAAVNVPVHRAAWIASVGPVEDGLQIDHLCRNRACVNPDHLEPVTPRVNTLRGESPSAVNARKTVCVNGHEFTPANTYTYAPRKNPDRTYRQCMECNRDRLRKRRAAR